MGMRVPLCKLLAAGSNSASTRIRAAGAPFRIEGVGGYTGSVTIEDSPDDGTTWIEVGSLPNDDSVELFSGVVLLRVAGTHTAGTATVYLIEDNRVG